MVDAVQPVVDGERKKFYPDDAGLMREILRVSADIQDSGKNLTQGSIFWALRREGVLDGSEDATAYCLTYIHMRLPPYNYFADRSDNEGYVLMAKDNGHTEPVISLTPSAYKELIRLGLRKS